MSTKNAPQSKRLVAQNRKARFDYHLEEIIEAGIVLVGSEVKSLRQSQASIVEAHATEHNGEIYLMNCYIPEYTQANRQNHDPRRPRKLLLHKREAKKMIGKLKLKGLTLVALSIYFNQKNKAKVEIALAKGKKLFDKRQSEKKQDWEREKARVVRDKNFAD
jgi:SsrA-binding protein